jgi:hypothetical protein
MSVDSDVELIDRAGLRRALAQLKAAGLSEDECREFYFDALCRAKPRRPSEDRS